MDEYENFIEGSSGNSTQNRQPSPYCMLIFTQQMTTNSDKFSNKFGLEGLADS